VCQRHVTGREAERTSVAAGAVIGSRPDGNDRAVRRQGHCAAAPVEGSFAVDVVSELVPRRTVPLVNAGVPGIGPVAIVSRRANSCYRPV
jgi:hypothetical protein